MLKLDGHKVHPSALTAVKMRGACVFVCPPQGAKPRHIKNRRPLLCRPAGGGPVAVCVVHKCHLKAVAMEKT